MKLARLITDLQRERAEVALHMLVNIRTGKIGNLTTVFAKTDRNLEKAVWKPYGSQKVFSSKLRFQARLTHPARPTFSQVQCTIIRRSIELNAAWKRGLTKINKLSVGC